MKSVQTSKRFAHLPEISAHEVGRPGFAVRNPIYPGVGDFEVTPVYDLYRVDPATVTTVQNLFAVPRGQNHTLAVAAAFIKTALHTSMTQARKLANPRKIVVRAISIVLDNRMNPGDVNRFLSEAQVTFSVGGKPLLESIAINFPAGGGAWAQFSTTANLTTLGTAGSGAPQGNGGYKLLAPGSAQQSGLYPQVDGVEINQGDDFDIVIDPTLATQYQALGTGFTTAAAGAVPAGIGISAYVYLHGTQMLRVS